MSQPERDRFLEEVLDALSRRRLQGMVESLEARSEEAETRALEADARAEQAARDAQRALTGMRRAVVALLAARGVACSAEGRARIDACDDAEILDLWLSRAATAGSEADVFAG